MTITVEAPAPARVDERTPAEYSRDLVLLAQAGDSRAVAELYEIYSPGVFRFIYFRVGNRPLAEDLAQDTWLRALKRLNSYTYQGKDLGAWLITIARNLVADHFKSGRYRLEVATGDVVDTIGDRWELGPEGAPEDYVVAHGINTTLMSALWVLSEEQRECLMFRFLRGLSVAETAQAMGKNEGAIKALQYRATAALRRDPRIHEIMASFNV